MSSPSESAVRVVLSAVENNMHHNWHVDEYSKAVRSVLSGIKSEEGILAFAKKAEAIAKDKDVSIQEAFNLAIEKIAQKALAKKIFS